MAVNTPDSADQVESRIKVDVQREAPDSNPYLTVHWLRSLIAGVARRLFDFYRDLNRTEHRLFPDTADEETAPVWGNIYVGQKTPASAASGQVVATGTAGGVVPIGTSMTANGVEFKATSEGTVADNTLSVLSITRSGDTATVITDGEHGLSSFVPVDIAGAVETEYNGAGISVTVTGVDSFTYTVQGSPATPATGTIAAEYTSAVLTVQAVDVGTSGNLDLDTPVQLQSPIVNVGNTLYVTYATVGGGTGEESTAAYKARYLDKIRNPVAHFNVADITAKAKEVSGVTRVFVERAGTQVGTAAIATLTREGNVAKAVTTAPHGFTDGQVSTIAGAVQAEYNVEDARILIGDALTFYYLVAGTPSTPATGTPVAATSIPLGQVRTFFMRDGDADPIPSPSEVAVVKSKIDEILPANTSVVDNVVQAPVAEVVNYTFTNLEPNTQSMRDAIEANLAQFHEEETAVSVDVDEDAYRAAIKNTVDPATGDTVTTFDLSAPSGDIDVPSGAIAVKGTVTF